MSNYQYRVDIWHLTCGGGWTAYALTGRKKNVGRIWGIPTLRGQFGQKPKRETWKKQLTKRGRKTGRYCSIKQTNKQTKPNNIKHQLLRGGSNWKLIIFVLRCDDFCFPDRKLRIRCMGKYFVSDWALNRKCLNKGYKAAVLKPRDQSENQVIEGVKRNRKMRTGKGMAEGDYAPDFRAWQWGWELTASAQVEQVPLSASRVRWVMLPKATQFVNEGARQAESIAQSLLSDIFFRHKQIIPPVNMY